MLHRAPVSSRRREHLCGSHCLSVVGLSAWGAPARGRQVPSKSAGVWGWQGPVVGSGCTRVTTPTAAGGGRLNLLSSQTVPVPFSAPDGRAEGRDTRRWSPGHRPGRGSPRRPGCRAPGLPGRVRGVAGLGHGRVAAGVRGVLDSWLPAAVPGRLCAAVQSAVGGLSTS
jgi:hypothetical protein